MKKTINRSVNCLWLALVISTTFFWGCSCKTSKPTPDPLSGFRIAALYAPDSHKAITYDYKDYLQKLSPEEKKYAGPIEFFEDSTGQHAVLIMIGMNGINWRHVLIYDKGDKRIKTIKYADGHYAS